MFEVDFSPPRRLEISHRILQQRANRVYSFYRDRYGVMADVYKPLYGKDTTWQEFADDLEYEMTPYYHGMLIMPFLFRVRNGTESFVMENMTSEQVLIAPRNLKLYRNSIIKIALNNIIEKETTLRIEEIKTHSINPIYQTATIISSIAKPRLTRPDVIPYRHNLPQTDILDVKKDEDDAYDKSVGVTYRPPVAPKILEKEDPVHYVVNKSNESDYDDHVEDYQSFFFLQDPE